LSAYFAALLLSPGNDLFMMISCVGLFLPNTWHRSKQNRRPVSQTAALPMNTTQES
jgi:hypothetical protein